jgi:Na+-driven multidrug efflux pump
MLAAVIGSVVVRLPLAYLAAVTFNLPVVWLWASLISDHIFRAIWNGVAFWRGRWATGLGGSLPSKTEGSPSVWEP